MTEKNNITLIGMPGSGKTSVGNEAARQCGMAFIDLDLIVEKNENMTISEIFQKFGEEYFRNCETKAVKSILNCNNTIISTGGGVVLNEENMNLLCENSVVVYIKRSCEDILKTLDSSSRPLLAENPEKLSALYAARSALYEKYADLILDNNASLDKITSSLLEVVHENFNN